MKGQVERFYDSFSERLLGDFVYGNWRVERQLEFFAQAIPPSARQVLVVGSGSGYGAYAVATRIAKKASVTAVDISGRNVHVAKTLFAHKRIVHRRLDIAAEKPGGPWDVILLPDVYEHLPTAAREHVHAVMRDGLSPRGRILLTVPTPAHQDYLRRSNAPMQPVDEDITLDDLLRLAQDTRTRLTHYSVITVWMTNDYAHAVFERDGVELRVPSAEDRVPLKTRRRSALVRAAAFLGRRTGWYRLRARYLKFRLARGLQRSAEGGS